MRKSASPVTIGETAGEWCPYGYQAEMRHFVECVRERRTPKVSGASAKHALDVAFEITRQIHASR